MSNLESDKDLNKDNCCGHTKCPDDCCVDELAELVQDLVRTLQTFEKGQITKTGFTMSQCYTLFHIEANTLLTMKQLSEKMNLDSSTVTRNVNKLVRDNYLKRRRSPQDRRVVQIQLTEKGEKAVGELSQEVSGFYRKIIDEIPEGQVLQVFKSVDILLTAFKKVKPFCC